MTMIHHTTLSELKKHSCSFVNTLVSALGKDWGENTPIPLVKIVETNGIIDAIWALRANLHPDAEKEDRLFACDVVERFLPIFERHYVDNRPRKAIEVSRLFAEGKATEEELEKARNGAFSAAFDASYSAYDAVKTASKAAAWAAFYITTKTASEAAAAWAAFYITAKTASEAAAYAEREAQKGLFLKRFGLNSSQPQPQPRTSQ